jgi:hypothetical protein
MVATMERDLGAAAFAVANVAVETARVPLGLLRHAPGIGLLSREGGYVRSRLRSRLEGILIDVVCAPETRRLIERLAGEVVADIDLDTAAKAVMTSPQFDALLGRIQAARQASSDLGVAPPAGRT